MYENTQCRCGVGNDLCGAGRVVQTGIEVRLLRRRRQWEIILLAWYNIKGLGLGDVFIEISCSDFCVHVASALMGLLHHHAVFLVVAERAVVSVGPETWKKNVWYVLSLLYCARFFACLLVPPELYLFCIATCFSR